MCFYDANEFACGCWKWGHFRQHCAREYRTGETCGMKLVMNRYHVPEKCRTCTKIDIKSRRIHKEEEKIRRWSVEGNRAASTEKSQQEISKLEQDIQKLVHGRDVERGEQNGSFLSLMSFNFIITSLVASLQEVVEKCRKKRESLNAQSVTYDRLGVALISAQEIGKGLREIGQIGFNASRQENFNTLVEQIEKELITGTRLLRHMDKNNDADGVILRLVRREESELYKFMKGLQISDAMLNRYLEAINSTTRRPLEPPKSPCSTPRGRFQSSILIAASSRLRTDFATFSLELSLPRRCILIMAMFITFITLSCFLGVYFTIDKSYGYSMGDAFTLAGWVIGVGTLLSTAVLAQHYPRCTCWKATRQEESRTAESHELQHLVELPG